MEQQLPPGFRFHPTDEELIVYYLCNQYTSNPCPASIIPEVDIYKFDPWELPEKAEFGENEWYFFTPRDRKYPNGVRPNRAAVSGYWKATGTDKAILSGSKPIGVKKALVFYKGKPPKGVKTDWIMHEYRLAEARRQANRKIGSMRLDDWVLCRIYKKKNMGKAMEETEEYPNPKVEIATTENYGNENSAQEMMKSPRTFSISNILDMDYMGPTSSHILFPYHASHNYSNFDLQNNTSQMAEMPNHYAEDMKQSNLIINQQPAVFGNHQVYDYDLPASGYHYDK